MDTTGQVEESGRVVRVGQGEAWVETDRKHACGGCQARAGCGVGLFHQALGIRPRAVRVLDPIGVREGDTVVIALRDGALVAGAARLYLLPLLGLLGGAVLGHGLQGEFGAILLAIGGLAGGFALVARFSRRIEQDPAYQPLILRRQPSVVGLGELEPRER